MRTTHMTIQTEGSPDVGAGAWAKKSSKLRKWLRTHRRGVSSVLAMMMAILVGALAVAMGTVTQGNLRNASTNLHVMRAMQAAETGLRIAENRIKEASSRFIVERGDIDTTLGTRLWNGTFSGGDGQVVILPAPSGHFEPGNPADVPVVEPVAGVNPEAELGGVVSHLPNLLEP